MTIWGILLILLVLALIAAIPAWPYSRGWGFSPFSLVAAACLLVVLLWALGIVEFQGVEDAVNDIERSQ
jgi:hypothetical protein